MCDLTSVHLKGGKQSRRTLSHHWSSSYVDCQDMIWNNTQFNTWIHCWTEVVIKSVSSQHSLFFTINWYLVVLNIINWYLICTVNWCLIEFVNRLLLLFFELNSVVGLLLLFISCATPINHWYLISALNWYLILTVDGYLIVFVYRCSAIT